MRWLRRSCVVALGVFVACSDPYSGDDPGTSDSGGDGGVADGGLSGVTAPDGEPPVDANGAKPGIDASCNPCDCDDDGFRAPDSGATCLDAGVPASDCDDRDPRAHPDAGFLTDQPTADTRGDWDCNGQVERQYDVNVQCADWTFAPAICVVTEGFVDDPACGATATYVRCSHTGTACKADISEMRAQGCR